MQFKVVKIKNLKFKVTDIRFCEPFEYIHPLPIWCILVQEEIDGDWKLAEPFNPNLNYCFIDHTTNFNASLDYPFYPTEYYQIDSRDLFNIKPDYQQNISEEKLEPEHQIFTDQVQAYLAFIEISAKYKAFNDQDKLLLDTERKAASTALSQQLQASLPAMLPPIYNPFIHGTNSSILALLPKTQFKFMSTTNMLDNYGFAPMAGEISKGGLSTPTSTCNLCFGRIKNAHYDKELIIQSYCHPEVTLPTIEDLRTQLKISYNTNFTNINVLLVYLARAKQWGLDYLAAIPEFLELKKEIHATKQFYYLLLCLADYANPSFRLYTIAEQVPIDQAIRSHYTPKNIKQILQNLSLDLEDVWKNPTQENLATLSQAFALPLVESTLDLFSLTYPPLPLKPSMRIEFDAYYNFNMMLAQESTEYDINCLIYTHFTSPKRLLFTQLKPFVKVFLQVLETRFSTLEKIIHNPSAIDFFSAAEKQLIQQPFPIILIAEDSEAITPVEQSTPEIREYRATQEITLGIEITGLATDTVEHQDLINEYLVQHGIENVAVILFDKLEFNQRLKPAGAKQKLTP